MSETNPPPVAPVEGHYARMRDGAVVGPLAKEWSQDELTSFSIAWEHLEWKQDGTGHGMLPAWDIIATISPANMQAVASGELEELKAGVKQLERQLDLKQDAFFALEAELERLRAALKAAEDKQCASCRHCDSFGLSAALQGDAP